MEAEALVDTLVYTVAEVETEKRPDTCRCKDRGTGQDARSHDSKGEG